MDSILINPVICFTVTQHGREISERSVREITDYKNNQNKFNSNLKSNGMDTNRTNFSDHENLKQNLYSINNNKNTNNDSSSICKYFIFLNKLLASFISSIKKTFRIVIRTLLNHFISDIKVSVS